jgi:hypothetical protein
MTRPVTFSEEMVVRRNPPRPSSEAVERVERAVRRVLTCHICQRQFSSRKRLEEVHFWCKPKKEIERLAREYNAENPDVEEAPPRLVAPLISPRIIDKELADLEVSVFECCRIF